MSKVWIWLWMIAAVNGMTREPPFADYVRDTTGFAWKAPAAGQLELISQNWHGAVWTHTVRLAAPAQSVAPDLCVLFVNGGADLERFARDTGVACASVGGIYPACHGQPGGEGIAIHAFRQVLKTGDPTWSISAATTKALARTMDALAEHGRFRRFILTGFSKMGLACWWAAVMDARVVGIIPIGADMLNLEAQQREHPQLFPQIRQIGAFPPPAVLDPYAYRERLTAAKLVISGTNDDHYDVTSVGAYWDGLPEPKWRLHLANATHALEPKHPKTIAASQAFIRAIAAGKSLPKLVTTPTVASEPPARTARLWTATATGAMKFAQWSDEPFTGELKRPGFVELEFDGFSLTTGIYP